MIVKRITTFLLLFSAFFSFAAKKQNLIPIEHFSKGEEFTDMKLSPTGEYLSFISKADGKNALLIMKIDGFKLLHAVRFDSNGQVGDYHWVNDERIVLEKQYIRGWKSHPEYYGELLGVNFDGTRGKYLVGYKGEMQTGSRLKKATPLNGTSYVLDPLVHDEDKMLISTIPWSGSSEPTTVVYEVDVNSGARKRVIGSPRSRGSFLTDHEGNVRAAISSDDYISASIYLRGKEHGEWQELKLPQRFYDMQLHGFDKSGQSVYVSGSTQGEPRGVHILNLKSGELDTIYQDKEVDPKQLWTDPVDKNLFAIELDPGYPTYIFTQESAALSNQLKSFLESLPGNQVQIVSATKDGEKLLVYAHSDINPGRYYLYDNKNKSLQYITSSRNWIDPNQMSSMEPIKYKTRDGLTIHGYLTKPYGKADKDLPLVVMPHGGPHGPRDYWQFDPEVQLLASRGIAVLQVNFRGSGGYGSAFEEAGYRKWGKEIQYDIIDGVQYLIDQGIADKNRMCIMGSSFGGYSALQSAILEPNLFKCAIGVVGVYDLPLMFEEGDVAERRAGQAFLKTVLGQDQAQLKAFSPSYNVDKLKIPVMIVHGGEDERAPIEQAESLIAALDKAKKEYVYHLLEDEGHGFYKPEHRQKYYQNILKFLDKHLNL
ncbi:alpha/beta hydrolase family protein [Pseudoalteromonas sp. T1lg65]|uniref:alpha/beta hydrolase family protein n=1 Tax=Pseudoalteromonas sp. T1lg65 TaxID=2077101 RepID=UPI003F7A0BA2